MRCLISLSGKGSVENSVKRVEAKRRRRKSRSAGRQSRRVGVGVTPNNVEHYSLGVTQRDFERFAALAVNDAGLLGRLVSIEGRIAFVEAVVSGAAERNLMVTLAEVEESLQSARRQWNARWI
jgi:hypothetical protein